MNFIVNNIEQDVNKELEIFSKTEFGMTACIIFKDGTSEIRNNLTEVHYMFQSPTIAQFGHSCAFESDIHGTGGTIDLRNLIAIVVYPATEKAKNY